MAFLGKKKIEDKGSVKDFPNFPSTFSPDLKFPDFPSPNDENPFKEDIKEESIDQFKIRNKQSPYDDQDIQYSNNQPMQESPFLNAPRPMPNIPPRNINYNNQQAPQPFSNMSPMMGPRPVMSPPQQVNPDTRRVFHEDKPLFVKIDDYEEAIYTLDKIKAKLRESDKILDELTKIRIEEERQLEEWKRDLAMVKEKLLTIDKQLFENN